MSITEAAKKWGLTDRAVRYQCARGAIDGAIKKGARWYIPENLPKPKRNAGRKTRPKKLLETLRQERSAGIEGGIYHKIQIDLTYNSNHIEGNALTHDQTRYIFETHTVEPDGKKHTLDTDDIIEIVNHFRCVDIIIDQAKRPLSENLIKRLHKTIFESTSKSQRPWFFAGDYKKIPNYVGDKKTTAPEKVTGSINKLLNSYAPDKPKSFEDIIAFHHDFEVIHPFQDGNGRVGRLILFKECLKNDIVPFIITDDMRMYYYQGLQKWDHEKGFLLDTCRLAQDNFKALLDYFRIAYTSS